MHTIEVCECGCAYWIVDGEEEVEDERYLVLQCWACKTEKHFRVAIEPEDQ